MIAHALNTCIFKLNAGGRFAQIAAPAQVVSLIISDVLGDPLEAIASGPTVPCLTTAQCCLDVMTSFNLEEKHPDLKVVHSAP